MQKIGTSFQTDNYTNTSSLNFYRLDALPNAQLRVSKHSRKLMCHKCNTLKNQNFDKMWQCPRTSHPMADVSILKLLSQCICCLYYRMHFDGGNRQNCLFLEGIWATTNTWFLGPQVYNPNCILISLSVF